MPHISLKTHSKGHLAGLTATFHTGGKSDACSCVINTPLTPVNTFPASLDWFHGNSVVPAWCAVLIAAHFPFIINFSAHSGVAGKTKLTAALTEALADVCASAGQRKVMEEEKQKWALMCQGQDGPTATLDLARTI